MTMTAKDKKLLTVAAIFLIAFAIILFGIKPGFTGYSENKAEIEQLKATKETMETEIDALPTYESNLKAATDAYNAAAARIYGDLSADEVQDTVMAKFIDANSLTITSFSVTKPTKYMVAKFANSTNEAGDVMGSGGPAISETGSIKFVTVSVAVSGAQGSIVAAIDAMNAAEGVYVQQISYSTVAEGTTANITFLMALSETFA